MEVTQLLVVAGSLAAGAGLTWLVMTIRRQAERIADLERRAARPGPHWAEELRLDHRAQLVSVAALVKLSARDNLDALVRLSPELAREVVQEIAPHLFPQERTK